MVLLQDARPLLTQSIKLVEEVTPLLRELREGGLVDNVEALTKTAADAAADIQKLQVSWAVCVSVCVCARACVHVHVR